MTLFDEDSGGGSLHLFSFFPLQMLLGWDASFFAMDWFQHVIFTWEWLCTRLCELIFYLFIYLSSAHVSFFFSVSTSLCRGVAFMGVYTSRNRAEFTGVYSLMQWNKGSLAAPSNGLCVSCTDHKLLLFCLNCSPSKDLTRMHFGSYSIQSSFCTECSLAPCFDVDIISVGLLSASCLSFWSREATFLTSGKLEGGIVFVMEGWEISATVIKPAQMKAISVCYGLIQIQTSLTNDTLIKVQVQFLKEPSAHSCFV